jgi:hypothetical protein
MLYILTFACFFVWLIILIRKGTLSRHAIMVSYVVSNFTVDMLEVLFNLLLGLYKFPTHLAADPIKDNQLGIIFADALILPAVFTILVYYVKNYNQWKVSLLFTFLLTALEIIYLKLGYLHYNHWNTVFSLLVYIAGFRIIAYFAERIKSYNPPIAYSVRILCFVYTINMWISAIVGMPVLELYQYKPGLFNNFMADDRFIELYFGVSIGIICALTFPRVSARLKALILLGLTCVGVIFALFSYYKGWLIYHYWNHSLTLLRYLLPSIFILLYDRWEKTYEAYCKSTFAQG